jgi:hypothetical protein
VGFKVKHHFSSNGYCLYNLLSIGIMQWLVDVQTLSPINWHPNNFLLLVGYYKAKMFFFNRKISVYFLGKKRVIHSPFSFYAIVSCTLYALTTYFSQSFIDSVFSSWNKLSSISSPSTRFLITGFFSFSKHKVLKRHHLQVDIATLLPLVNNLLGFLKCSHHIGIKLWNKSDFSNYKSFLVSTLLPFVYIIAVSKELGVY